MILFFVVIGLQSCSAKQLFSKEFKGWFAEDFLAPMNLWKPKPFGLGEVPEGGSPEYTQGWKDGCETGLGVYGANHYRNLGYKFKQDHTMIHNNDYYMAWQDSYTYCRWYVWNYIKGGGQKFGAALEI